MAARLCFDRRTAVRRATTRRNGNFRRDAIDFDKIVANKDAGDANALLDVIDGRAAKIKPPAPAKVAAKRKTAFHAQ